MKFAYRAVWIVLVAAGVLLAGCSVSSGPGGEAKQAVENGSRTVKSNLHRILESGKMRVGTTGDFNPMSFRDPKSGAYVGYYIDVVKALAEDMGVEIEWVATDWKNLVSGLVAGKYEITTGASYNMGRAKSAAYTLPIIEVGTVPMVLQENLGRFTSWQSINQPGVTVAVTLGTVFDEQARVLFPNATIKPVEAPARDFQEVLAGRADVSITSNIEASQLVQTYPQIAVVPVEAPRYRNLNGMLLPQGDEVFRHYLDVWIRMKETQGVLETMRNRWLSP